MALIIQAILCEISGFCRGLVEALFFWDVAHHMVVDSA